MDKNKNQLIGILLLAAILFFGLCATARAEESRSDALDWRSKQVLVVAGEIDNSLVPLSQQLMLAAKKSKEVFIFINSPGGAVIPGNIFVQAMEVVKARGGTINCAVSNIAASMAMHILAHCSTRHILAGGYLLFHEVRASVPRAISPSEATTLLEALHAISFYLEEYLIGVLRTDRVFYDRHNKAETLWSAELFALMFPNFQLKIIRDIKLPKEAEDFLFAPAG